MSQPVALERNVVSNKRASNMPKMLRDKTILVFMFVALLIVWDLSIRIFEIPQFILPSPVAVAGRVWRDISTGVIFVHLQVTLIEVVAGFLLATLIGVGLGCAVGLAPVFEKFIYPYILALQTVPKVALAPLMVIWIGYGIHSKITTAALIAFFPILVNVVAGLKTVDDRQILLMRALKASPWQMFVKVRLPSMLPYLFAGLEVGVVFAVIGAVVAEFLGSSKGLGSIVLTRQSAVDVAGVFSALLFLSLMGILLTVAVKIVARRFAFWEPNSRSSH